MTKYVPAKRILEKDIARYHFSQPKKKSKIGTTKIAYAVSATHLKAILILISNIFSIRY